MENKQKIMNVPNTLSLARVLLVPLFMAVLLYLRGNGPWAMLLPAALFGLTALTDMLDGKIARRCHLVTDFGKMLDPLADKFMIFGALVALLCAPRYAPLSGVFVWVAALVMLRELSVTSLRMVVATRGTVVPASFWGKAKTVTQIAAVEIIILNPLIAGIDPHAVLSYIAMAAMTVTTVGSGLDYFKKLWPYVSGQQ
ncbi:MAG: CDP-diacylglycerol--glycerol-3-phosphate 3-phosphatidyltransferase [Eubacteriales bacterium]